MAKVYTALLKRFTICLKRSENFGFPMFFFIYKILIENSVLQIPCCISLFQTDMIFFDQFKVTTIKFGKFFAEFMIPIALLKKFGSKEFVSIIAVSNMRRFSGKANKLRYIYTIRGKSRDIEGHRHQGTEN